MPSPTSWIIGLEPGDAGQGPLRFARWLRGSLAARTLGVHVRELWVPALASGEGAAYVAAAAEETDRWLASLRADGAGAAIDALEVVEAMDVVGGLVAASRGAPGLVVGRRFARAGVWVRLGAVVRRLLRHLPAPVIVAPPELGADAFDGPVVLATALDETSVAAARYAAWFAREAKRPLVCVHVGQLRWSGSFQALQPGWEALRERYRQATEDAAGTWMAAHCPGAELAVEYGDPADLLPAVAGSRRASLLVIGSGRPSLAERIFAGSVASLTAAAAPCAVAVVPPDVELAALA